MDNKQTRSLLPAQIHTEKSLKMVFLKDWQDFEMAAESMYIQNPSDCRFSMKYVHSKGHLVLKLTDNAKVILLLVYPIKLLLMGCFFCFRSSSAYSIKPKMFLT